MFFFAKKDVSRENKPRWRGKKRSCRAAEEKELRLVGVGGWLQLTEGAGYQSKHRGHHKEIQSLQSIQMLQSPMGRDFEMVLRIV